MRLLPATLSLLLLSGCLTGPSPEYPVQTQTVTGPIGPDRIGLDACSSSVVFFEVPYEWVDALESKQYPFKQSVGFVLVLMVAIKCDNGPDNPRVAGGFDFVTLGIPSMAPPAVGHPNGTDVFAIELLTSHDGLAEVLSCGVPPLAFDANVGRIRTPATQALRIQVNGELRYAIESATHPDALGILQSRQMRWHWETENGDGRFFDLDATILARLLGVQNNAVFRAEAGPLAGLVPPSSASLQSFPAADNELVASWPPCT